MLIGISGKQRSGKDTVAEYLNKKYGFIRISFANPLKRLAIDYFGLTPKDVYVRKPDSVRKFLQELGRLGRSVDKDFWIKKALSNYDKNELWVVSDVRYKNEAKAIKNLEGVLIRIEADRDIRLQRGPLAYENDLSETDLDDYSFDYVIYNNSTFEKLYKQVDKIMNQIL